MLGKAIVFLRCSVRIILHALIWEQFILHIWWVHTSQFRHTSYEDAILTLLCLAAFSRNSIFSPCSSPYAIYHVHRAVDSIRINWMLNMFCVLFLACPKVSGPKSPQIRLEKSEAIVRFQNIKSKNAYFVFTYLWCQQTCWRMEYLLSSWKPKIMMDCIVRYCLLLR